MTKFRPILILAILLAAPSAVLACLWDCDTLRQERARFPTALELITGKFLRHSTEFYRWRISDRTKKLEANPENLEYHDDLAVAYEMTGDHAKAIETILAKERIKPGVYETYSNLGTFHILAGDFKEGLPYIDKALAINPDAHFGRERYQKWLVEYALERRPDGKITFPLRYDSNDELLWQTNGGFEVFLLARLGESFLTDEERQRAIKGILGMMRFANHANPLLLEALGDLLSVADDVPESDAKRLSARCYLKASYSFEDSDVQQRFRRLAQSVLRLQAEHELPQLEAEFTRELTDAQQWYAELKAKEAAWIRDGKDVEAEFDRLYANEPVVASQFAKPVLPVNSPGLRLSLLAVGVAGGLFVFCLAVVVIFVLAFRNRRQTPPLPAKK